MLIALRKLGRELYNVFYLPMGDWERWGRATGDQNPNLLWATCAYIPS